MLCCATGTEQGGGATCVQTYSYWRTHGATWPVTSLTIGGVTYTSTQLMQALNRSTVGGNALVVLARQIIALELNEAAGVNVTGIATYMAQAQALLVGHNLNMGFVAGNTPLGAQLLAVAGQLERYNQGLMGVPHCF